MRERTQRYHKWLSFFADVLLIALSSFQSRRDGVLRNFEEVAAHYRLRFDRQGADLRSDEGVKDLQMQFFAGFLKKDDWMRRVFARYFPGERGAFHGTPDDYLVLARHWERVATRPTCTTDARAMMLRHARVLELHSDLPIL